MVTGWLVAASICLGVGLLLTGPLADSALIAWDERVPKRLEAARTATWDFWSNWGTFFADTLTVITLACIVGAAFLFKRQWALALLLVSAMVLEVTVFTGTTFLVERDRPAVDRLDQAPPTSSYPSGHTAAAMALYGTSALIVTWHARSRWIKVLAWLAALTLVVIVACSRVYRGMHHPTDVMAGFLVGAACVFIASLAVRAWQRRADDQPTNASQSGSNESWAA